MTDAYTVILDPDGVLIGNIMYMGSAGWPRPLDLPQAPPNTISRLAAGPAPSWESAAKPRSNSKVLPEGLCR